MKKITLYFCTFKLISLFTASSLFGFTPLNVNFGSDFDGDGGITFQSVANTGSIAGPGNWSVRPDHVRYVLVAHGDSEVGTQSSEAGAFFNLPDLAATNAQDFTMTVTGRRVTEPWSFSRFGVFAMGDGALGSDYGNAEGHTAFVFRPGAGSRDLRLGDFWGNDDTAGGIDGPVQDFTFVLSGTYDGSGALTLNATLTTNEGSWDVGPITYSNPESGISFGFGGRFGVSATGDTVYEFHSMSIIPEPQTYAGLFGVFALLITVFVRYRKSS